jgi:hypothetical protein
VDGVGMGTKMGWGCFNYSRSKKRCFFISLLFSRLYYLMRTLNIYCPRSTCLDRFKYSHMREHLTTIHCQASMSGTPSQTLRFLCPQTKASYQIQHGRYNSPKRYISNKDFLKNDAPVAWDNTGLTSAQFGPDRC